MRWIYGVDIAPGFVGLRPYNRQGILTFARLRLDLSSSFLHVRPLSITDAVFPTTRQLLVRITKNMKLLG